LYSLSLRLFAHYISQCILKVSKTQFKRLSLAEGLHFLLKKNILFRKASKSKENKQKSQ